MILTDIFFGEDDDDADDDNGDYHVGVLRLETFRDRKKEI